MLQRPTQRVLTGLSLSRRSTLTRRTELKDLKSSRRRRLTTQQFGLTMKSQVMTTTTHFHPYTNLHNNQLPQPHHHHNLYLHKISIQISPAKPKPQLETLKHLLRKMMGKKM